MQTMYIDLSIPRIALTRALGRVSPAAYFGPTSPLHLATLPDPPLPAPDWVRVRNRLCGICGSDLHQIFVDADLDVAPLALPAHRRIYLGHEMVGVVTEVGEGVKDFKLGDRVVRWGRGHDCIARGDPDPCPWCQRGQRVLCERASEAAAHEAVGGGFGEGFVTPASTLIPVPDNVPDEAAIFTEPAAVAIHAASRRLPKPGEKVLVLGCGPIGFLLIQALRAFQPACHITALAQFDWQADLATCLGAESVILTRQDTYAEVAQRTGARLYSGRSSNRMLMGGFDVVFDVVGTGATLTDALRWTRAGGTVVLVGALLHRLRVDLTPVWYQEVTLVGAVGHGQSVWDGITLPDFELALQWMQTGRLQTAPLLTHVFPLAEYRRALATAVDKQRYRSVKVAFDLTTC
ncbi:MAG: alcohol dehydrogenase catalytic domain-containing protein [Anaerolineae bacterium]|nr:alcohol dehydrogenase catalytic domain-containing protein [Anaerolineae bacterium]